jgi:uncharacterized RDD family membrane protein YckC
MNNKTPIKLKIKPKTPPTEPNGLKRLDPAPQRPSLADLASEMLANKRFAGKKCVFCHGEIKIGQHISLCKECKTTSHMACWEENLGCAVFGCKNSAQGKTSSEQLQSDIENTPPLRSNTQPDYSKTLSNGNFLYANFWDRAGAYIIDLLILILPSLFVNYIVGFFGSIIISWLYFSIMESSEQQATVGKKAMGLVVADMHGKKLSFARATGRHLAKIFAGLLLGFGYIMVIFTEKKQGLHDLIAECIVIKA